MELEQGAPDSFRTAAGLAGSWKLPLLSLLLGRAPQRCWVSDRWPSENTTGLGTNSMRMVHRLAHPAAELELSPPIGRIIVIIQLLISLELQAYRVARPGTSITIL